MHERHVRLMREMDENYKMIEQETQEYYIEFLQKWKEVAKSKITQYRKAIEQSVLEKEAIVKTKDVEIENLTEKCTLMQRDLNNEKKERIDCLDEINELNVINRKQQDDLNTKEREKQHLKTKLDEKENAVNNLRNQLTTLTQKMKEQEEELNNEIESNQRRFESKLEEIEEEVKSKNNEKIDIGKELALA